MLEIVSKVARNGQLTIPSKIRRIFHIREGDSLRFEIKDNQIVIIPVSIINRDQAYFFTKKWQKSIQQSEKAIEKGEYSVYHSAEELKKDIGED